MSISTQSSIIQPADKTVDEGVEAALKEAMRLIHLNRAQGGVTIPSSTPKIIEKVTAELRSKGYHVTPSEWTKGSLQVNWGI